MRNNPGLIKTFLAGAAIGAYTLVKFGSDDKHVVEATAATDAIIGVTGQLGASAAEEPVDVILTGIAEVKYGGSVTRGALLTATTGGQAVAASPGAGTNASVIGRAMASGVSGDIGSVLLSPGQIQG